MDVFNMFSSASYQKSGSIDFLCPSCGSKCQDKDEICSFCSYDLKEYKNDILAPYKFFNDSIKKAKDKNYFEAIIDISKFLAFYPDDLDANKLYIYILHKNGQEEAYNTAIDAFEEKFVRNPWIMEIETDGIDSYQLPQTKCEGVVGNKEAFSHFTKEYVSYRTKTVNDIIQLVAEFYDIVRSCKDKTSGQKIAKFYETNFYQFLSKKEINVVSHDGQIYDELAKEDLETITVQNRISDRKKNQGCIVTYYPAVFLRHALISKEVVAYVDNETSEIPKITKPSSAKAKKRNPSKRRR